MSSERNILIEENMVQIAQQSDGYSGADMRNLCSEASLGPIRCIDMSRMHSIQAAEVIKVHNTRPSYVLNKIFMGYRLDQYQWKTFIKHSLELGPALQLKIWINI